MKERTCCFTGHRKISNENISAIKPVLQKTIITLIKKGYIYFQVGGALGFDVLAEITILKLKLFYPQIKLILVLPCENQTKYWCQEDIEIYNDIKSKCDRYIYISKHYTNDCMLKRNRYLVDNSSYCICYQTNNTGGTAYTIKYAKDKGLNIINIAKEIV